ncbi:MAG: ABC transporter substrate-binding protein [Pseudomonadota bacterium]
MAVRRLSARLLPAVFLVLASLWTAPLAAQAPSLKLAVISSTSGENEGAYGRALANGVRLAVEEANAQGGGPRIELDVHDAGRSDNGVRETADRIVASDAIGVVGPLLSTSSLLAGPIFARAGLASIVPAAESDLITASPTTFRTIFANGDMGDWLASYLRHALGGSRAVVIFADDAYGRTVADGFRRGAGRLGLDVSFAGFTGKGERDAAVVKAAEDPDKPAIVLAMLDDDAVAAITALRRLGVDAPILGGTGLAGDSLATRFGDLPEARDRRGFFTRGVYAATPVLLDSANDDTRDFADRYRQRFGEGGLAVSWVAVQAYDAGRLAIAALRAVARTEAAVDLKQRRQRFLTFLDSLDGPGRSVAGLLGPIWFTADRGRAMPIRVGWFRDGRFESAPVQLVPVSYPDALEIAAGEVVEVAAGRYARRQKVVYTGMFLNELPRIDVAQSTFTADLYVWMRFVRDAAPDGADPAQIEFPHMLRGSFAAARPATERDLDDGTTYRLWRVTGEFKNDFDLHRYPADRQALEIEFFNARAASDRLVYVVDRSGADATTPTAGEASRFPLASSEAFRNLTQWHPVRVMTLIDNLVAQSALGDPALVGLERVRELSGFKMQIDVQRDIGTTLIKTLLPIGLMTLIMFATLYFPPALAAPKVMVAITAGLSGAVLLSAINAQLGNVGYVIAVEYGFYVFFALCLVCIVVVLTGERLRLAGRPTAMVDRIGRIVFATGLLGTVLAAVIAFAAWR